MYNQYLGIVEKLKRKHAQQYGHLAGIFTLLPNEYTDFGDSIKRSTLVKRYSWAIPNERAIEVIAQLTPSDGYIIEMGAGRGYWASLVETVGGKVRCFDLKPGPDNIFCEKHQWHPIEYGEPDVLSDLPAYPVLLIWPPYNNPMANDVLTHMKGDTLILVSERGGCCANESFWENLFAGFTEEQRVDIPRWQGCADKLMVWRRK